ncbi:hypothetical protein BJF78_31480 [Pseudonocardia sp. CNS-139]|nr:hypothetical protein BJF78_31480 [Pseudonocardia sp. CNS-139]
MDADWWTVILVFLAGVLMLLALVAVVLHHLHRLTRTGDAVRKHVTAEVRSLQALVNTRGPGRNDPAAGR